MAMDPRIRVVAKYKCENSFLFFCKYFIKKQTKHKLREYKYTLELVDTLSKVATEGEILRLLINIAPRLGKTQFAVIFFIAWCIARNPAARFIHLSFSDELALDNSSKIKELILSDEFQELWPIKCKDDAKSKRKWYTEEGGGVYATSTGGAVTGFGAGSATDGFEEDLSQDHWLELKEKYKAQAIDISDFLVEPPDQKGLFWGAIIIDDPLKPKDADSPVRRKAVNEMLLSTVQSRVNSTRTPIILIMQRIHEEDPCGFLLDPKKGTGDKWVHLCLKSLLVDKDGNEYSICEERLPLTRLIKLRTFAPSTFNGQYQQSPTPEEGDTIQLGWFNRYAQEPADFDQIVMSLDTAYSAKDTNDPSVCMVFGKYNKRWYLLQIWKKHVGYPELRRVVSAMADKWNPHAVLIENKASGQSLVQDMLEDGYPAIPIQPEADKVTRMKTQSPFLQAGLVYIPEQSAWLADFLDECVHFPLGKHDDQVDALSQFLKWQRGSKVSLVVTEEEWNEIEEQLDAELEEYYDDDDFDDDDY